MGIFPSIDRAWMTIDNKLFLWSFHESADFSRYDSQSELILHVGLVPAKPNVFIDSITHLLVICTPTTLILLGLSNAQGGADLTLYATDLSISTDGVGMSDVRSMPDGRTFMTGSDGCLYEMQYRADEGWFTKRCSLVNWTGGSSGLGMLGGLVPEFLKGKQEDPIVHLTIDPTRSVLYALTKYSNIELFLIGSDGQSLTKIARASDICRTALMLAPDAHAMLQSNGFTIMSVSPIERGEGEGGAQMVAVTGRGVRLYFSYHRKGYAGIRPTAGPPTALELTHVRLRPLDLTVDDPNLSPPLSLPANNPVSASSVYLSGVFIAPQKSSRDNLDVVLFTTTDLGRMSQSVTQPQQQQQQQQQQTQPNQNQQLYAYSSPPASTRPPLIEQALALPIEGRTWAVAEVPHPLSHGSSFSCPPSLKVPGRGDLRLNELSAQTEVGQRTFLILSNMGMHVIVKQRPVDMLKAVLEAGAGGREGEVVAFFDKWVDILRSLPSLADIPVIQPFFVALDETSPVRCASLWLPLPNPLPPSAQAVSSHPPSPVPSPPMPSLARRGSSTSSEGSPSRSIEAMEARRTPSFSSAGDMRVFQSTCQGCSGRYGGRRSRDYSRRP
jgi:nuclear pore complex protein Nup155